MQQSTKTVGEGAVQSWVAKGRMLLYSVATQTMRGCSESSMSPQAEGGA